MLLGGKFIEWIENTQEFSKQTKKNPKSHILRYERVEVGSWQYRMCIAQYFISYTLLNKEYRFKIYGILHTVAISTVVCSVDYWYCI